jgi:hypothetical protein
MEDFLAKDGPTAFMPLIVLVFLFISYMTRPQVANSWLTRPVTYASRPAHLCSGFIRTAIMARRASWRFF